MTKGVRGLGEFGVIDALRRAAGAGAGRGSRGPWVLGIGDDAAILRPRTGRDLVVAKDALVEDVHFRWSTTDADALARKALAVNLSDLGAMGARPLGFLLALGLPASFPERRLSGLRRGFGAAAREADCPLVGGDTVEAPQTLLSVTVLGDVPRGRALRRDGARVGDRLCVTGTLGGAALGLALLESGRARARSAAPFVRRQRRPVPRWREGQALARVRGVTSAIDVSDGLLGDLAHVTRASAVGADVDVSRVPLPPGLERRCAALGLDPLALSLAGGEDYELLFTLRPSAPGTEALARRLGCPVTEIGHIRRGRGVRLLAEGRRVAPPRPAFEHFKPA